MTEKPEQKVLMVIVQSQDLEACTEALDAAGIDSNRLPSVGGFLGKRNATMLIRLKPGQEEKAIEILQETCKERIEYIVVPLESASLPLATPTPINVGGATIFEIEIERYEEL